MLYDNAAADGIWHMTLGSLLEMPA